MVLDIDRDLHVVAHDAGAATARCHRAAVRVGQRYLLIWRSQHLLLHRREALHLAFGLGELLLRCAVLAASASDGSCKSAVSSWLRYRATLASSCARRRSTFARVKLRSRLLTALNLLPSMATLALVSRPMSGHSATNWAHTLRIADPLSLRKSAIVLSSGTNRPRSQITSRLRPASRSSRRLDCTRLR